LPIAVDFLLRRNADLAIVVLVRRRWALPETKEIKMLTGINADIRHGYTGADHLIDSGDEVAVTDAVAGQKFRRASDALRAAEQAFQAKCDRRVRLARVVVRLRTARGDEIEVG
jgi:hypothetical protein